MLPALSRVHARQVVADWAKLLNRQGTARRCRSPAAKPKVAWEGRET